MKHDALLYADDQPASQAAEKLLNDAGAEYAKADTTGMTAEQLDGRKVPLLMTTVGFFRDSDGIEWYARTYGTKTPQTT